MARGLAATVVLGVLGLLFLVLGLLFISVIGLGLAIGAGVAGIGLAGFALRRTLAGKRQSLPSSEDHLRLEEKRENR